MADTYTDSTGTTHTWTVDWKPTGRTRKERIKECEDRLMAIFEEALSKMTPIEQRRAVAAIKRMKPKRPKASR